MTLSSASAITVLAWLTETGGLVSRYNFTSPISKSQFIAPYVSGIGALLAVCIGMNAGMSRQRKLLLQIALLILGLSTIIVMSRTVFIINVITFFIYIVLSFKNSPRRQRKVIRVIGLLVSVVLGIFLFTSDLLDAFISLGDAEDLGILNRATMVKQALYVFAEHPFLGVGFGYETLYLTEPILYRGEAQFLSSVHNGLASLLLQWGLVGMLVYTFFIARITRFFYRGWKLAAHPFCRAMCALSLSLIGADIANMVVGQNMVIPIMQAALVQTSFILWVLFGITAGLIRLETVKQ